MGVNNKIRLSSDKDNSTDIASSYVKGEKIKKMLKAASYESQKGEMVVKLDKMIMSLEHACYHIDLLSRANTNKAYDLVCNGGVSKLNLNRIK